MCNICINSITFTSNDIKLLKELHKQISLVAEDKTRNSMATLLSNHGYSDGEISLLVDSRDYFSDCDQTIIQKLNIFFFSCETCTAWDENLTPLYILLKEKYKNKIHIYHQSEEEGLGLYSYSDETGLFYSDRYKADLCINDNYSTEYFHEYTDMINYLEKLFPKASISPFMALNDVEEAIKSVYDDGSDPEFFITLNMFMPYNAEKYRYAKEVA